MSYNNYQQQSYSEKPYDNGAQNLQAGTSNVEHEMSNYSQASQYSQPGLSGTPIQHQSTTLTQQNFLERVDFAKSEIKALTSNIQAIAALHQRALASPDNTQNAQLENLVTQTQLKNTQIKDQVKFLEADALKTQDGTKGVKARQAKNLKHDFEKVLKEFQQEEMGSRQRYREQIARQYRIVNPDASDAEVEEASEMDWGSEGVFQTALKSNRSGQASSVLGFVRARHNDLRTIDATLGVITELFADLAQIVEAQEPIVQQIEQNTDRVGSDVEKGNVEIVKAQDSARRRRRNKWWCLLIVVLIILAIALAVGLGYGLTRSNKN